jgi:glycosyltransferase involved in cell wall biosynthesis
MLTISIITVAYNSEKTIRDTLLSISRQSYPNVEHIIVDGGSKDSTMSIVKEFSHIHKVISEPDKGVYDAMNKGLRLATGDVIGFLNSDDMYTDNRALERIAQVFELKNTDSLYSDLEFFEGHADNVVRVWNAGLIKRRRFLYGWMPPHPTFFVKKEVYQRFGVFDLAFKQSADYELMLRFLYLHGISSHYLQGISLKMRVGGLSNATLRNRWEANCEDRFAWHKNALKPYFFTVLLKPLAKLEQFQMMYRVLRLFKQKAYHTANIPIPSTSSPILEEQRAAAMEFAH